MVKIINGVQRAINGAKEPFNARLFHDRNDVKISRALLGLTSCDNERIGRRRQQLAQSNVPPLVFNTTGGPVLGIVGLTEGVINKVKVIKRRAYGLPTFAGFRERVLLACG